MSYPTQTKNAVLISGAGQLGSRYLQGLTKCRPPLRIYVQDALPESLKRAESRWKEMPDSGVSHEVSYHSSFEFLPSHLDIAIVATTANVRPQVVDAIARQSAVKYWVVEKVLAQSESGLDEIQARISGGAKAWVNHFRRGLPWYQEIKAKFGLSGPLVLEVGGGAWGLACNAVHFLDLLSWWSGETLVEMDTSGLDSIWFESKRPGNFEIFGTLRASFSGGSRATISAGPGLPNNNLTMSDGRRFWKIEEGDYEGVAKRSDGLGIPGCLLYQSETSAALVESILETGNCTLPVLEEAISIHRVFIRGMQQHWMNSGHPTATFVPIT